MAKLYLGNDLIIDPDVKLEKVELTLALYNALTTKDPNKLYIITDAKDTVREDVDLIYQAVNDLILPGMTDINNDLLSSIQSFCNTALYPYGGYSADKGYYLMDLTNLSEDQIVEVAVNTMKVGFSSDLDMAFLHNTATMLLVPINPAKKISLYQTFINNQELKYIYFKVNGAPNASVEALVKVSDVTSAFANCPKLEKIEGILDFENASSGSPFTGCDKLSEVKIRYLHTDLDLSYTNISSDCLKYIIENRSDTNYITIYTPSTLQVPSDVATLAKNMRITLTRKVNG